MIGQDRIAGQPAGDGGRRRDRGRRALARAAPARRRPRERTGTALDDGERDDAARRSCAAWSTARHRHGARRACPARCAARAAPPSTAAATRRPTHAWFIAYRGDLARRRARRERPLGRHRSRRRSPSASSTRWGREGELSSAAPRGGCGAQNFVTEGRRCRRRPAPWRVAARPRVAAAERRLPPDGGRPASRRPGRVLASSGAEAVAGPRPTRLGAGRIAVSDCPPARGTRQRAARPPSLGDAVRARHHSRADDTNANCT